MKGFICRFPDDIHNKIREESFLRKKSMADIVREAVHDYCLNKAQSPISQSMTASQKKRKKVKTLADLSASCLQKIWDNDSDDCYNDL